MNIDEKFEYIINRLQVKENKQFKILTPDHISLIVIISYINELSKLGLIDSDISMSSMGDTLKSIAEEFDWNPSNSDIEESISFLVKDIKSRPAIIHMLKSYRDNKEEFLDKIKNFKLII